MSCCSNPTTCMRCQLMGRDDEWKSLFTPRVQDFVINHLRIKNMGFRHPCGCGHGMMEFSNQCLIVNDLHHTLIVRSIFECTLCKYQLPMNVEISKDNMIRIENSCIVCNKHGNLVCSKCKKVRYCGKECQKSHWSDHKLSCTL